MSDPNSEIQFPVAGHKSPLTFLTVSELTIWLDDETAFWSWLQNLIQRDNNLHALWPDMNNGWAQIRKHINHYQNHEDPTQRKNHLNTIRSLLTGHYNDNVCALPSSTAQAQYVDRLRQTDAVFAGYVLQSFLRRDRQQIPNASAVKGIVMATLFEQGLAEGTAEAQATSLGLTADNWNDFHTKAEKYYAGQKELFDTLKTDMATWRSQQESTYESIGANAQASLEQIAGDGKANFEAIQKTYNEQLGLQAPVQYWEDRANSYLKTAVIFSIASICAAALGGAFVWAEIQALVIPFSDLSEKDAHQFGVHAWRYAFVIATAALMVWPVRILARILLSALHLRIDAQERATLAKTYLSLLRSKEGLDPDDRRLVLEILFRPTSSGIVKDDAAPASLINFLSRLGSGDKK